MLPGLLEWEGKRTEEEWQMESGWGVAVRIPTIWRVKDTWISHRGVDTTKAVKTVFLLVCHSEGMASRQENVISGNLWIDHQGRSLGE